jgi:DNA polymerase elongation subunit (family B)
MLTTTLPRILFLDIETVSTEKTYSELSPVMQELWEMKAKYWLQAVEADKKADALQDIYLQKAGIYAEFGKIVCISVGLIFLEDSNIHSFRLKSFSGDNEAEILTNFAELLEKYYPDIDNSYLCGHNIKEFDVPYISRRMIINKITLPALLNISDKKPWETKFLLDTLDMWKFGDYKHYTSLRLLAQILGIPSPKDDIDGSEVGSVYWEENDIERITAYCEKDVKTTAQVFLALKGMDLIPDEKIILSE